MKSSVNALNKHYYWFVKVYGYIKSDFLFRLKLDILGLMVSMTALLWRPNIQMPALFFSNEPRHSRKEN